ncbi:unnamed protein product [Brassica oleracea]|uniref:Leucine-rich repeat-containing N-terminal plant-type domain-containing protein n=1 Tax=Brassica oleracea TaxID=3712 RepID=A0A3P6ANH5_BRAOL|nr:unnamed protein product [Brassica oleracea]
MNGTSFILLIVLLLHAHSSADYAALQAVKSKWTRFSENWIGVYPCGSNWVRISCYKNRVVSISLGNLNVEGKLGEAISALLELHIL